MPRTSRKVKGSDLKEGTGKVEALNKDALADVENQTPQVPKIEVASPVPSKVAEAETPQHLHIEPPTPSSGTTPKGRKGKAKGKYVAVQTALEFGPSSTPSGKGAFGRGPSSLVIKPRVEKIYKIVRKSTGALGGNGYDGAIYGELTMHSMQKLINIFVEKCEMTSKSRFIDVGSGLGKPNFHAAQDPAVRLSLGIELETIRWQLAMHNLHQILPETEGIAESSEEDPALYSNTNFICNDIDVTSSTDPFTHIYMYDLGFPPPLQQSIAKKFNTSVHAQYLASYRPPHRVIHEYLYEVELVHQMTTAMHGSGENHMCYFYKRTSVPAALMKSHVKVTLPAREGFDEEDTEVVCDPAYLDAVRLAIGDVEVLKEHVSCIESAHLSGERPKRERKPSAKALGGR